MSQPTVIRFHKSPQGFLQVVSMGMSGRIHVQHYRTVSYDGKPYVEGRTTLSHDESFESEDRAIDLFDDFVKAVS